MSSLASLSVSIAFLLLAAATGRLVSGLFRSEKASPSERLVVDTSLGLGVVSLVVFALAAMQLLRFWAPVLGVLVVVTGLTRTPGVVRDVATLIRRAIHRRSLGSWLVGLLLLALALSALIPALALPSMSDWDSLAYHLSMPKLYLAHGGFYYIDFSSHSNFPFLMEMLYIPGLALGHPVAAKMMHFWTGVLLVLAVVVLARKHFSTKAAPMAALAVAGMPIVLWEATTAYVDLATALYTVLAVHLLLNHLDGRDWRYLVGCGAAVGFAASTKMTGLVALPLLVVWLVVARYVSTSPPAPLLGGEGSGRASLAGGEGSGRGSRAGGEEVPSVPCSLSPLPSALLLAGVALLVCAPWYVKSVVYTGNPVYPFFYSIFGGRDWTAELAANYTALQKHFGMGHDIASFLLVPYNLAVHPEAFYDTPGLFVGPLLMLAVPLLVLGRYRSRKLAGLLIFFLAQVAVWFALTQQSRYLIPMFGVLAVIVSEIALDERFRIARRAVMGVVVATALFGLVTMAPLVTNSAPVVFGVESQGEYLLHAMDTYPAQHYINENLPRRAKVALFGDTRGFYLDRSYVWADSGHNAAFTRSYKSVADFVAHLKSHGVTHAMVNYRFFPPRDKARDGAKMVYKAIEEGRLLQVYPSGDEAGSVGVYEVR